MAKTFVSGNYVGGVWSPVGNPAASDDVLFDATSGNCAINAGGAVARSIDCAGYTNTLSSTGALSVGDGTTGHFTLVVGMGFTYTGTITFVSTTTGNQVTTAGKTLGTVAFNGTGGAWTLQDTLTVTNTISLTRGTLDTNSNTVSSGTFSSSSDITRVLTLGSTVWSVSGTNAWNCGGSRGGASANLTVNAGTSVILFTNTSATNKVFVGGGNTWNIWRLTMGGTGTFDSTTATTFAAIETTGTPAAITIRFTAGTTTTFTGDTPLPSGTSGNLVTISSTTAATHTLSKASGTVVCDYLSLTNSIATGGATWYAGSNSVDNGGNSGWIFTDPPRVATASLVGGSTTLSSSLTFSPGTKTASVSLDSQSTTLASTDTFSPGTKTATSSLIGGSSTLAAPATFSPGTKIAAVTLLGGSSTLSSSVTNVNPVYTASVALNASSSILGASTTFVAPSYTANASLNSNPSTLTASATHVRPSYTASTSLIGTGSVLSSTVTFVSVGAKLLNMRRRALVA